MRGLILKITGVRKLAIIKTRKKENPFIQIDKTGLNDKRLTWAAKGLLTYLIGLPEDWEIILEHLKNQSADKRDATRNALNNLREFGYCHYFEIREKGKVQETIYLVYETPMLSEEAENDIEVEENQKIFYKAVKPKKPKVSPKTDFPETVKPETENPTLLIKEDTNNKDTNNKKTPKGDYPLSLEEKEMLAAAKTKAVKNTFIQKAMTKSFGSSENFLIEVVYPSLNKYGFEKVHRALKGLYDSKPLEISSIRSLYYSKLN